MLRSANDSSLANIHSSVVTREGRAILPTNDWQASWHTVNAEHTLQLAWPNSLLSVRKQFAQPYI